MTEQLTRFICLVRDMRTAQTEYFAAAGKARKTKAPGDWAAAANALKRSKALEIEVDKQLPLIINH